MTDRLISSGKFFSFCLASDDISQNSLRRENSEEDVTAEGMILIRWIKF
jgi:hypothetical protein